jgi:Ca2+-binding RTX toxin-like protein
VADYSGTTGGLSHEARRGNETLNARGSTSNDEMYGDLDPAGGAPIVAGAGIDTSVAGTGSDTLVGGSGHDLFAFVSGKGDSSVTRPAE